MLKFLTGFALTAALTATIEDYSKIETYHTVPTSLSIPYHYEKKRDDIHGLEKILVEHSYLESSDECFDANTEEALKALQSELDLKATGKVDKSTREKLNALYAEDFSLDLKKEVCRIEKERKVILDVSGNLFALNYFNSITDHLTPDLIYAVELYKRVNTLVNSASINKEFLKHLNMKPEERVKKLEEALLEFKKLETEKPIIIANLPEYKMYFLNEGKVVYMSEIAIGEAEKKWNTNVQDGAITFVRVNPTWFIPSTILPEVRGDKRLKYTGGRYIFEPGPTNPLGRLAFPIGTASGELFHDTPSKGVFKLNRRAISHGCMRLSDARGLFLKFQEFGFIDPALSLDALIDKKVEDKYVGSTLPTRKVLVKVRYILANAAMTENGPIGIFPYDIYKKR